MKQRKILLDTAAIAAHFRVATGTVRYWASTDSWPKYGTRRHRQWDLLDAEESHAKRHKPDGEEANGHG